MGHAENEALTVMALEDYPVLLRLKGEWIK